MRKTLSSFTDFEDRGRGPCAKAAGKGKERDSSPELPKEEPCQRLDFSSVRPMLEF